MMIGTFAVVLRRSFMLLKYGRNFLCHLANRVNEQGFLCPNQKAYEIVVYKKR